MSGKTGTRSVRDVEETLADAFKEGSCSSPYVKWAKHFDSDCVVVDYCAPAKIAREFAGVVGDRKDLRIIDIGAGTGRVAEELAKYGFSNIDALDGAAEMLEIARDKGVYRNIYCQTVSSSPTPGFEEGSYDASIAVGVFYPGALLPEVVYEFLRLVRRGGFVVFGVNSKYGTPYAPEDFQSIFQQLERDGRANVRLSTEVDRFLLGDKGTVYALEKL